MVVDPETRALFIADTGAGRILAVNADSGKYAAEARNDLGGNFTLWSSPLPSFEYTLFGCASYKTFATGIDQPSGLVLSGNVLYVGEHGTGKIIALHRTTGEKLGEYATGAKKLFGLAINPTSGDLWFVDGAVDDALFRLDTSGKECASAVPNGAAITWPASTVSETDENWCGISTSVATLGLAVHSIEHDDGYLNMAPLGPGYGITEECMRVRAGVRQRHALNVGVPLSPLYPRQLPGRHLSNLRRLVREYNRGGVQVQVRRRRVRRPLPVQGHERRWACWGAKMGGIDARLAHRDVLLLKRLRNVH